jgi:hypothetical protein
VQRWHPELAEVAIRLLSQVFSASLSKTGPHGHVPDSAHGRADSKQRHTTMVWLGGLAPAMPRPVKMRNEAPNADAVNLPLL